MEMSQEPYKVDYELTTRDSMIVLADNEENAKQQTIDLLTFCDDDRVEVIKAVRVT
jgi:hypothetical protein